MPEGGMFGSGANAVVAPLVSVAVPAYNAADYLERAVDSALSQTMPSLEIIIVDDASTDATLEMARRIATYDPRVRVLRNELNSGPAASRNRAIGAAQGEWIALLDGDDAWSPRRLELMLADAKKADVVSDDVNIVRKSLTKPDESVSWSLLQEQGLTISKPRQLSLRDFARYDLGLLQPIIRRSFLERHRLTYDQALRYNEDFLLYFELLALGARWLQLPDAYYFYYKHGDAITVNKGALWQSVVETSQTLLHHPAAAGEGMLIAALESRIREARGHVVFAATRSALRQRHFVELARALRENPSDLLLLLRFLVERLYLRAVRRVRSLHAHWRKGDF